MKTKKRAVRRISCVTDNRPGLLPHAVGYNLEEQRIHSISHSSQTPEGMPLDDSHQTSSSGTVLSSLHKKFTRVFEENSPAFNDCHAPSPRVNVMIPAAATDNQCKLHVFIVPYSCIC